MGAILTIQEVAERMRCEHRTVRRAIKSGELEAALIGGKWLVREEAVDEWFRSRCASANLFASPVRARGRRAAATRPDSRGQRRAAPSHGATRRMSVRRRGKQFEVRWSEGGRKRLRSFLRADDARAFDVDIKRRKQLGALAPGIIQSRQTLAEFMEGEWWPRHAIPNLAQDTRRRYLEVWDVHLLPRRGDFELREISPMVVEDFREQVTRAKVGAPTQRKTLMLLQASSGAPSSAGWSRSMRRSWSTCPGNGPYSCPSRSRW
jgi:excisionase family DNA binding protein